MAGYLKKYVGKYRVIADYDLSTGDFPRNMSGSVEDSFDDYYIKCKNGIQIRHVHQSTLMCYIPSIGRARNIMRTLYNRFVGSDVISTSEKDGKTIVERIDIEEVYTALIGKKVVTEVIEYDSELEFQFHATMIEVIAEIVEAKTSGKTISPLSPRNLPKQPYSISEEDMALYKEVIGRIPQTKMYIMAKLASGFDEVIAKKFGKKFEIKAEQRKAMLNKTAFIHSLGMWPEYVEYLRDAIANVDFN